MFIVRAIYTCFPVVILVPQFYQKTNKQKKDFSGYFYIIHQFSCFSFLVWQAKVLDNFPWMLCNITRKYILPFVNFLVNWSLFASNFGGITIRFYPWTYFFYVLACNGKFCLILEKYFNITSKKNWGWCCWYYFLTKAEVKKTLNW